MKNIRLKVIAAIIVLIVGSIATWWGLNIEIPDSNELQIWFLGWGSWGPVAIIFTMTVAILISPIPSAPIALASGALFGHYLGTLYVVIGSELGAIGAFFISRFFGYELLRHWFGDQLDRGLAGSQKFLMGTIFVSRLIPFVSFDIISYAAGLTEIQFWRFALATLAGVVPIAFLLAHFGDEMASDEADRILLAVLLLGMATVAPLIVRQYLKSRNG